MRPCWLILASIFILCAAMLNPPKAQHPPAKVPVMTLGVFHFDYPNLDAVKVDENDQISVFDEPFQSEIIAIANALAKFNPTIVAVESLPQNQDRLDSLFNLFKMGQWALPKNEIYQLGFRLGKQLQLERLFCVDDPGRHYENVWEIFSDSARLSAFEYHYFNTPDTAYLLHNQPEKVSSIISTLINSNDPEVIRNGLSTYLLRLFKYEESPGDFVGVDFESGRWFNRNLRIFRNIQRINPNTDDRILLIIGSAHLNLLNYFFEISEEFELISPIPYLDQSRMYLD